ncbi:hypothetical protein Pelo_17232 [Pelomyxa schiedti]|nr:hypothetical protein Pelo_17232 [Pelomyxa schiedti]
MTALKKPTVVSLDSIKKKGVSTVPEFISGIGNILLVRQSAGRQSGSSSLILRNFTFDFEACVEIEEGTGKVHHLFNAKDSWGVAQLDESHLCSFDNHNCYDVWDVSEPGKPQCQERKPLVPGCSSEKAFLEGGLVFQMSESMNELHVTDEHSGAHVITFQLFCPIYFYTRPPFSFLL